jgi:hypothetical protein
MAALLQRTSPAVQLKPWWILETFHVSPLNTPDLSHTVCVYQGHTEGVFPAVAAQVQQESLNLPSGDLGAPSNTPTVKCQLPPADAADHLAVRDVSRSTISKKFALFSARELSNVVGIPLKNASGETVISEHYHF